MNKEELQAIQSKVGNLVDAVIDLAEAFKTISINLHELEERFDLVEFKVMTGNIDIVE